MINRWRPHNFPCEIVYSSHQLVFAKIVYKLITKRNTLSGTHVSTGFSNLCTVMDVILQQVKKQLGQNVQTFKVYRITPSPHQETLFANTVCKPFSNCLPTVRKQNQCFLPTIRIGKRRTMVGYINVFSMPCTGLVMNAVVYVNN